MSKLETKQTLVQAFFNLYQNTPIDKITIKNIVEKAGYHRSTFYEYYTDIYDLLEQEEQEIFTLQKELLLEPLQTKTLTIQPLKKLFHLKGEKIYILIGENGHAAFRKKLQEQIKNTLIENHTEYMAEFLSAGLLSTCELAYKNEEDMEKVIQTMYPYISKML